MLEIKNNLSNKCNSSQVDHTIIDNYEQSIVNVYHFSNNPNNRIGILEGKYKYNDYFDEYNDEIINLFY